jgi:hypothetical protein
MRDLSVVPKPPALSEDAKMVVRFLVDLRDGEGYRGDVFHAFKLTLDGREWTRPRWDTALAELATPDPVTLSPPVTLPEAPFYGSDGAEIEPFIPARMIPLPTPEKPPETPLEAPVIKRENTRLIPPLDDRIPRPPDRLPVDHVISLRYARESDLRNDGYLLAQHKAAVLRECVPDTDAGILQFFAAAEHCLHAQGIPDRVWLFRTIVTRSKWNLVTSEAQARARYRLDAMHTRRHGDSLDVSS